jgi:hypothetical protein
MSGPHGMPISICMVNTALTSRRPKDAKAYVRSNRQEDHASAKNFSISPGKPMQKILVDGGHFSFEHLVEVRDHFG